MGYWFGNVEISLSDFMRGDKKEEENDKTNGNGQMKWATRDNGPESRTDNRLKNRHQDLLAPPVRPLQVCPLGMAQAQGYRQLRP